jgi:hypothetical protein
MSKAFQKFDVAAHEAKVAAGRLKTDAPSNALPPPASPDAPKASEHGSNRPTPNGEQISEKELQKQVGQLLRLKGVWFDVQRMDKKTRGVVGRPDFLFAWQGRPCAFEFKVGYNQLSSEQSATIETMKAQGWRVAVIRSTQEAFEFLKGDYV